MSTQQTGITQPAAAPVASSSTPAPPSGIKTAEEKRHRFTRAERRAFAKEKKAQAPHNPPHVGKKGGRPPHKPAQSKRDFKSHRQNDTQTVDEMIAYLISIRGKGGNRNVQDMPKGAQKKGLENRITRGAPVAPGVSSVPQKKKKELSPEKLEKIQKRKDLRNQKRKAAREAREASKAGEKPQDQVTERNSSKKVEGEQKPDQEPQMQAQQAEKANDTVGTTAAEELRKLGETKVTEKAAKNQQKEEDDDPYANFDEIDFDDSD